MTDPRRVTTPRAIDAVCFDLDDTLFDFGQYVRAGLEAAADRIWVHTGRRLHDELRSLYFEEGVTEGTFDRLLERHDLPDDLVPELVSAYHDQRGPLEPYPDAVSTLTRLGSQYALGVLTDGRNGRGKLRRLGIADRFDAVVVTHERPFAKPDVEAFERLLSRLDVEPAATVYVGDHPGLDVRGANELGMTTVRLRRGRFADRPSDGEAAPDLEIHELSALLDWLCAVA